MNEITKFDVQLMHQGKLYKVGLKEADLNDARTFQVAGRTVTPFEYPENSPLPAHLNEVLASLDKMIFSSEKDLMKKLKKDSTVHCFSVTKKVYELGTFRLLQSQTIESKYGLTTKGNTYQSLRICPFSNIENISMVIQASKLPVSTLFEIADKIELQDRNIPLAHAIRETSRPFNLSSALGHISDSLTANCIKGDSAAQMTTGLRNNHLNGKYEHIYEKDDFANVVSRDLQAISHNRHVYVLDELPPTSEKTFVTGFGEIRTPPNGTAYLDILSFENPKELVDGKPLARDFAMAALKQIVDSKPEALVIDVRNHGGGSVYMSELVLSYFLEEGLPLTSFEYKVPPQEEELLSFPVEPCHTWSYEKLPKDQRLLDAPIYVLTSPNTFSAGEDIACHLKERGRATLIGETTGGGGDPNKLFDAQEFFVAMPIAFARVPYGPSWEGVGVIPHIQVEQGQNAMLIANQLISEGIRKK